MKERKPFFPGVFEENENGLDLIISRCGQCGKVAFPVAEVCPRCGSTEHTCSKLTRRGRLAAFTITRVTVGPWEPPHYLGQVEFPEEKLRMVAPLVPADDYQIGSEVEVAPAKYWDEGDQEVWGYKFHKIGGSEQ